MINDITVFNIREYLSVKDDRVLGEEALRGILSEFLCEKNSDVERFLKEQSIVIVPCVAKNNISTLLNLLGFCLRIVIYSCLFLLGITTVIFIRRMLQGNVYMFFCTIQNITMMYGLILYHDYLKHMENVEEIGFIFTPYLICIPVMLAYWAYVPKNKKGYGDLYGRTN